jgi:hypothetical protein
MSAISPTSRDRQARRRNALLWTVQGLLAGLFLFAGGVKLAMPIGVLQQVSKLPGALGLVLPGLLRIKPGLTPLAAAGLVIIMIGATAVTAATQGIAPAALPFVVGALLIVIIRGRRQWWSASA